MTKKHDISIFLSQLINIPFLLVLLHFFIPILFRALGAPPFEQVGVKETLECIVTGQYIVPDNISKLGIDFLKCLINKVS